MAIQGQCNAVASTIGVLGAVFRKYAHKIPFIVKINHNELLSYPNAFDQKVFASVKQAFNILWLDFHNWCTIVAVGKKQCDRVFHVEFTIPFVHGARVKWLGL